MKILFITARADLGGGPEHLLQLLLNLPPKIEAYVACPDDAPYRERFEAIVGTDRIHIIPHRAFTASALRVLVRLVRARGIDVVHSHGKGAGLYGRALAFVTKVRSVHTFHGLHVGEYSAAKRMAYLALERVMGWVTDQAICVSEGEAQQIREAGFISSRKLAIVPNGVVVPKKIAERKHTGPLRILAANRFDHQKNPDMLIEIVAELAGKREFELTIIGTGARIDEIRKRVDELGLSEVVHILGGVMTPRKLMRENSIFLSTSRWEGMPLAVLEAMSEGLCVLATDVVGNRDVITTKVTGQLFDSVSDAVQFLETVSIETINVTGQQAFKKVERDYSVIAMAEATFKILNGVSDTLDVSTQGH